MNYTLFLESQEFGRENFATYSDIDEACQAVRRLLHDTLTETQKDKIVRTVGVTVSPRK